MPETIRLIIQFQPGWPRDIWPFQRSFHCHRHKDHKRFHRHFLPWFETHGIARVPFLIKSAASDLKGPLVVCAVHHNFIDLLVMMVHQYAAHESMEYLLQDAAERGHLPVVAYLHDIGYHRRVPNAAKLAATHGHVHVLAYLHRHVAPIQSWMLQALDSVVLGGPMASLEYLLEAADPKVLIENECNPLTLRQVVARCLKAAVKAREAPTAAWLARRMAASHHGDDILQLLHRSLCDADYLLDCVVDVVDVSDDTLALFCDAGAPVAKLQTIFATLTCLAANDDRHLLAQTRCLERALSQGNVKVAKWLVDVMPPATWEKVFYSPSVIAQISTSRNSAIVESLANVPAISDDILMLFCHAGAFVANLAAVFSTLTCLINDEARRSRAQVRCLERSLDQGNIEAAKWLLESMPVAAWGPVLESPSVVARAVETRHLNILLLLETYGVAADKALLAAATSDRLKDVIHFLNTTRIDGKQSQTSSADTCASGEWKWNEWLVARQGGRVVVMRHVLVVMAQSKQHLNLFASLYNGWLSQEKSKSQRAYVQKSCFQKHGLSLCLDSRGTPVGVELDLLETR
ncbi:Aste57867_3674 [Aphanomyces stellatus]|uniref:Aste57867_3674 protein n=1 Tax=Aphanomyces stellatus TaxID=120398 RepID=A0A485KEK7_9STRA|nr:hypothetical protein As57867_003663 [Aphanomyces stellatus]VFT80829.1 Aste57867_3674 [Aphanomyces stellatus]